MKILLTLDSPGGGGSEKPATQDDKVVVHVTPPPASSSAAPAAAPAQPPATKIVVEGDMTEEKFVTLNQELESERAGRKKDQTRLSELEDENHRLRQAQGAPTTGSGDPPPPKKKKVVTESLPAWMPGNEAED